ncbi:protein obstructor-E [Eurosta solidaginis]|uniref:protein obstructor-E n=1 Tax=Eurosta solidaginis TaxID=178769 RepID=UPI0035306FDA
MWRLLWALTCLYYVSSSGMQDISQQASIASGNEIVVQTQVNTERKKRIALEPATKPQVLSFTAMDVSTNKDIDPMINYDPYNIMCQHYGAYFLPHPTDCGSYYVCAFGHILQHKCGRGTGGYYKSHICEMRPLAECYAGSSKATEAEEEGEAEAVASTERQLSGTPPNNEQFTVCYTLSNGKVGPVTWVPQTIESEESLHTPPTLDSIATTGRVNAADPAIPICPKSDRAYFPNSTDCSKYFICIIGRPVLTSCPEGLYWNKRTKFCDYPVNVECQQNKF